MQLEQLEVSFVRGEKKMKEKEERETRRKQQQDKEAESGGPHQT